MNCAIHQQTPAAAYCRTCGKALCENCKREVRGVIYCEDCIAARVEGQPAGAATFAQVMNPNAPNPGLALGLGFIPGVGAMYCGEYVKAAIHVLIFAALCAGADKSDFFGVLIPFWIFYMAFDSYSTAKAKQMGKPVPDLLGFGGGSFSAAFTVPSPAQMRQAPVGAIILIALGVLFLLANIIHGDWFWRLSPVLLILLGVWLFRRRRPDSACGCVRCAAGCGMWPAILVTVGVLFLIDNFTHLSFQWPVLLIVIGVVAFLRSSGSTEGHIEPPVAGASPPANPPSGAAQESEVPRG